MKAGGLVVCLILGLAQVGSAVALQQNPIDNSRPEVSGLSDRRLLETNGGVVDGSGSLASQPEDTSGFGSSLSYASSAEGSTEPAVSEPTEPETSVAAGSTLPGLSVGSGSGGSGHLPTLTFGSGSSSGSVPDVTVTSGSGSGWVGSTWWTYGSGSSVGSAPSVIITTGSGSYTTSSGSGSSWTTNGSGSGFGSTWTWTYGSGGWSGTGSSSWTEGSGTMGSGGGSVPDLSYGSGASGGGSGAIPSLTVVTTVVSEPPATTSGTDIVINSPVETDTSVVDCLCENGGICDFVLDVMFCDCTPGYSGDLCEVCATGYGLNEDGACVPTCPELDECSGHGTCSSVNLCTCDTGYSGADCAQPECDSPCAEHGTCTSPGQCTCDEGYFGDSCTDHVSNPCDERPCAMGTCHASYNATSPSYTYTCQCNFGYSGPLCTLDICAAEGDSTCGDDVCVRDNSAMGYTCMAQMECPVCSHGTCVEDVYACQCDDGYYGLSCDKAEEVPYVSSKMQLSVTLSAFTPDRQLQFRMGVARVMNVSYTQVVIVGIEVVSGQRRSLLAAQGIEVTTAVYASSADEGLDDVAESINHLDVEALSQSIGLEVTSASEAVVQTAPVVVSVPDDDNYNDDDGETEEQEQGAANKSGEDATGSIVGGVLGGVAGCVILAAVVVRRRRQQDGLAHVRFDHDAIHKSYSNLKHTLSSRLKVPQLTGVMGGQSASGSGRSGRGTGGTGGARGAGGRAETLLQQESRTRSASNESAEITNSSPSVVMRSFNARPSGAGDFLPSAPPFPSVSSFTPPPTAELPSCISISVGSTPDATLALPTSIAPVLDHTLSVDDGDSADVAAADLGDDDVLV